MIAWDHRPVKAVQQDATCSDLGTSASGLCSSRDCCYWIISLFPQAYWSNLVSEGSHESREKEWDPSTLEMYKTLILPHESFNQIECSRYRILVCLYLTLHVETFLQCIISPLKIALPPVLPVFLTWFNPFLKELFTASKGHY